MSNAKLNHEAVAAAELAAAARDLPDRVNDSATESQIGALIGIGHALLYVADRIDILAGILEDRL